MVGEQLVIGSVLIAGFLSFFAPCILPLLPVYVSYLSGEESVVGENKRMLRIGKLEIYPMLIIKTMIFVAGLATSFVILGFGAGALGQLLYNKWFFIIIGAVVIALGIHQTGLLHINFLEREKKLTVNRSSGKDILGAYLLGFTFSFGWTPCIGPVLAAVLGISAGGGSAAYGGFLMLVYSIGLMIPFLLIAIFSSILLTKVRSLNKYMGKIKVAGGIIIILMGVLLMTNNLNVIATFFET